jgi:hypothetical protein
MRKRLLKATIQARTPLVGWRAKSSFASPETWRLDQMLLAASAAFSKDVGLIATFIGIGIIVNVIVVFIAVQVIGERQQNQQRR